MFTMGAFYEDQDGGAVLHYVAAVADQHLTTNDDDIRVPESMPNIVGIAVLSEATTLTTARLESPALRRIAFKDIEPIVNAIVFGSPPESIMNPLNPTPLQADEGLRLAINSDDAAATDEYGLVWFSDGKQTPVEGQIYTVRATSAVTLSAGTWVNGNLTFDQTLPSGTYELVGMRARGTNLVAARLVFQGQYNRPGVPAVNAIGDRDLSLFRFGRMGSFGRFDHTNQPTVDCMGVTDSAQVYMFDLIKVA